MKKTDIEIGATYTDDKGRFRRVLDRGNYPLYARQEDTDCIAYTARRTKSGCKPGTVLIADNAVIRYSGGTPSPGPARYRGSHAEEGHGRCTAVSFATWAKRLATEEENARFHG